MGEAQSGVSVFLYKIDVSILGLEIDTFSSQLPKFPPPKLEV